MKHLPKISCLFFVVPACLPALSWADTPVINPPEEIVVTATRLPQKISQSLQRVTVITAEDLAQSGGQTLAEVLQSKGGVEVTANGGFGQPAAVRIRGAESRHTLILIDGMRVDSATTGATALENIPLNQIERIEIVPGALSSVYGSDAVGGVVQVFTKTGKAVSGVYASAGAGNYGTYTAQGGIGSRFGEHGDTALNIGFGLLESAGFSATKSSIPFGQHNPDSDAYRNKNFSAKLAQHFSPDHEAGVQLFSSEGRTQFDNGLATDDANRQTLSTWSVYSRNRVTPLWQSLARLGSGQDRSAISGAFPGSFRTDQDQFTWQNDFSLSNATITAGIEHLQQKVTSTTAYTATERTVNSLFTGYQRTSGDHSGQINLRHDDNSQFGGHTTGSVGYGYRVNSNLRLRTSVGTAFKAPTFNDLYFPGFSNPNLRPERSNSRELGLDLNFDAHHFAATYFDNRIDDLIVFIFPAPRNLNHTRNKGSELSYRGEFDGWRLNAQATLQNPEDVTTGKLLVRRAKEYGSVGIDKTIGTTKLGAQWVLSGERFDRAGEVPASRMGGYGLLNLTASYALAKDWTASARLNNAFDRQYELTQHFNTPGRGVFVSLQYQPR